MSTKISDKTIQLRSKLSGKKIYFKDIMPNKRMREALLSTYTSTETNLSKFKNKLYEDPIYSQELPMAVSTFTVLHGDWLIDEEVDDYGAIIIKFTDNKSGQYIKIGFPDQINKLKFLNEIHTTQPVKQENSGMNISDVVNSNTLYEKKKNLVAIGIGAIMTGIGLLIFSKNKKINNGNN